MILHLKIFGNYNRHFSLISRLRVKMFVPIEILSAEAFISYVIFIGNWIWGRQWQNSWYRHSPKWWGSMDVCRPWGVCHGDSWSYTRLYFKLSYHLKITLNCHSFCCLQLFKLSDEINRLFLSNDTLLIIFGFPSLFFCFLSWLNIKFIF